jgi:hypothetical protein
MKKILMAAASVLLMLPTLAAASTWERSRVIVPFGDTEAIIPAYSGPEGVDLLRLKYHFKVGIEGGTYDCSILEDCYGVASASFETDAYSPYDFSDSVGPVGQFKCIHNVGECIVVRRKKRRTFVRQDLYSSVTGGPLGLTDIAIPFFWVHQGDFTPFGEARILVRYRLSDIPVPASLPLLVAGLGGLGFMARRKRKSA